MSVKILGRNALKQYISKHWKKKQKNVISFCDEIQIYLNNIDKIVFKLLTFLNTIEKTVKNNLF